jgi:antitoxin ParD1/3/4
MSTIMATLNISLPVMLRTWVDQQVEDGKYSSASDYLRDLIRDDIRHHEQGMQWLENHLRPLTETPDEKFLAVDAKTVKLRARQRIKDKKNSDKTAL